ncbi:MAG: hypothetical protein ACTSWW_07880, partial [Promethearchaeota archaeon]
MDKYLGDKKPAAKSGEKQVEKKPTEPVKDPVEAPAETPVEAPVEAPVETLAEAPVETPVEAPVETPVEAPVETLVEAPVETPVETPAETPVETPQELLVEVAEKPRDGFPLPPSDDIEVIHLRKDGGVKIPKNIRENLPEGAAFAFWQEKNRLIFQLLDEQEAAQLQASKAAKKAIQKTSGKKRTRKKKKKREEGTPQPEFSLYFPFTVDNMDPLVNGFEGIFDILIETPPRITEAIERIK